MKLILFALCFPLFCFAQSGQKKLSDEVVDSVGGTSILFKNREVFFQKVYTSKLTADELEEKLFTLLSITKNFRFDRRISPSGNELIGKLDQYKIDVKRYGWNSVFPLGSILNYPVSASVIINIKDFKYRVTVSDLTFNCIETATKGEFRDVLLSDYITKKNRSRLGTGKSDLRLAQSINQDLSDKFDLQKSNLSDDF